MALEGLIRSDETNWRCVSLTPPTYPSFWWRWFYLRKVNETGKGERGEHFDIERWGVQMIMLMAGINSFVIINMIMTKAMVMMIRNDEDDCCLGSSDEMRKMMIMIMMMILIVITKMITMMMMMMMIMLMVTMMMWHWWINILNCLFRFSRLCWIVVTLNVMHGTVFTWNMYTFYVIMSHAGERIRSNPIGTNSLRW